MKHEIAFKISINDEMIKKNHTCPHRGIAINMASPNPLKLEGKKITLSCQALIQF